MHDSESYKEKDKVKINYFGFKRHPSSLNAQIRAIKINLRCLSPIKE